MEHADSVEYRASLCVKAGWLKLELGQADLAAKIFSDAHEELVAASYKTSSFDGVHREWIAAAGIARAAMETGRSTDAETIVAQVDDAGVEHRRGRQCMQLRKAACVGMLPGCLALAKILNTVAENVAMRNVSMIILYGMFPWTLMLFLDHWGAEDWVIAWGKYGHLLQANLAVAARAPDSKVLTLLEASVAAECEIPAGCRSYSGMSNLRSIWGNAKQESFLESAQPEWQEFLGRVAAEELSAQDFLRWQAYRDRTIELASAAVETLSAATLERALNVWVGAAGDGGEGTAALRAMTAINTFGGDVLGVSYKGDLSSQRQLLLQSYFAHPAWAFVPDM
jgi:hypothetical protein